MNPHCPWKAQMVKSAQNMLYQVHIDDLGDVYSLCGVNASCCCSENRI